MKKIILSILAGLPALTLVAQDFAKTYAASITADELKEQVYSLAGEEFEGRETGRPGQKKAAEYLVNFFKSLGMPEIVPGYMQTFQLIGESPFSTVNLSCGKDGQVSGLSEGKDFIAPNGLQNADWATQPAVFLGFGVSNTTYDDYAGMDVTGKIVIIYYQEPITKKGEVFTGANSYEVYTGEHIYGRIRFAEERGALAVVFISDDFDKLKTDTRMYSPMYNSSFNKSHIPYLFANAASLTSLTGGTAFKDWYKAISKAKSPKSVDLSGVLQIKIAYHEDVFGDNIMGFIEGSDLKDEIVVITAHYDHLGIHDGQIYYGADDDGSGTSAIMEIAEAFMQAKAEGHGPRRSILIMPVSGEEKGLLGSDYYAENPVFPLENTVANLNIDMIGRIDPEHKKDNNYVYIIGSDKLSTDLHLINENANSTYTNLALDYTYNDPNDPNQFYYRSDHYNFAKNNIPVIFYFTGVHVDYHQPTDTPEKLDYSKVEKITRLVFYTAWDLANRDERPVVDKQNIFPNSR